MITALQESTRIIPALAGNTNRVTRHLRHPWDHPRSRGEYARNITQPAAPQGSSPLSRGIRSGHGRLSRGEGIIPALAGNTAAVRPVRVAEEDHPRSRGEYFLDHPSGVEVVGSSPLSRGIHLAQHTWDLGQRIIPALAGNTHSASSTATIRWDHPRSRGEYRGIPRNRRQRGGSSPLSRGIHCGSRKR